MKKVIILLGVILTLAIAPAFFASSAAHAEGHGGGGSAAKEGEVTPEFEYYQVPPVNLPVITERGLTQQVSLAISIEVPYGKKQDAALYGPKLVDAYIRDLFGALGAGQVMVKGGAVDVETLKTRLAAVTEKVLGKDKELFRDLLLQAVQQHSI